MNILLDSSVLVRLKDPDNNLRALVEAAIEHLDTRGYQMLLTPQILMEYWAVATRPPTARGGLGLTLEEATLDIQAYQQWFGVLHESDALFDMWWSTVQEYSVLGRQVWDARIAAVMRLHSIEHIVTFNTQDFQRYDFLQAWSPDTVRLLTSG